MRRLALACLTGLVLALPAFAGTGSAPSPWSVTDPDIAAQLTQARRLIDAWKGEEAEPLLRALQVRVEARYGADSAAAADVLDLLAEAAGLGDYGRLPEVRAWVERAVAIRDRDDAAAPLAHAFSLHRLALLQKNAGELAAADSAVTRGLAVLADAGLDTARTAAWLLATQATVAAATGGYPRADAALDRADTILAAQTGPQPALQQRLLAARAEVRRLQRRLDEAIELQQQALAVGERRRGPNNTEVANLLSTLGNDLNNAGRLREARTCLERALAIRASLGSDDDPSTAAILNNLAMVQLGLGEYAAARRNGARSLAITRQVFGSDHPNALATVNNLGIIAYQTGDWETARDCFEQVLAADERKFGADHLYVAGDLTNLAAIVYYTGDVVEADRLFDRAVSVATAAGGPEHPAVGLALANQAEVLAALGRLEEARAGYARGIPLAEAGLGADSPDVASLRDSYGVLLARLGEDEAARDQLDRALAIRVAALGEHHPDTALSRRNVANLLAGEGDAGAATALLEGVCADIAAARGPRDPRLAEALADLASARWQAGQRDSVLGPALRAEAIGREHLRLVTRGLPERQALAYAAARPAGLDLAVAAAQASGREEDVAAAWDAAVRSRGLVLDEMVARRAAVWLADDPTAARLAADLADARERCANLSVRGAGELAPAAFAAELDGARQAKERAERELARRSAAFRQVDDRAAAGLAEVADALPPATALVAYQRYRAGNGEEAYAAFVLPPDRLARLVGLGPAAGIDALVDAWRGTVAAGAVPPGPLAAGAETACREAGTRLRAVIWDPVQRILGDPARVLVVPDGALHLVNLAALPSGEDRYLLEDGPLFHLLNGERDLLRAAAPPVGRGLLALGGPDFDASGEDPAAGRLAGVFRGTATACADFAGLRFAPLPGATAEVRAVGETWERATGAGEAVVLTGRAADETSFKRRAAGHRVLHLATHGFFLGEGCGPRAGDGRAVPGALAALAPAPAVTGLENPLLLSGMALAGANHRGDAPADADDGVLTAEEIAALDLDGVRWAVLSGCDTGRGTLAGGEGLLGLRRAFQVAGARTVISSLWPVRDDDARLWMEAFYRAALTDGAETDAAVRQASREVLAARRADGSGGNPLAWAAFVAAGDWR